MVAFTDATKAVNNTSVMYSIKYASAFNLLLMQHPEDKELKWWIYDIRKTINRTSIKGIPIEAEVIQVERDIRLVEMTTVKYTLNITTGGLEVIKSAQDKGLNVTCSTSLTTFH